MGIGNLRLVHSVLPASDCHAGTDICTSYPEMEGEQPRVEKPLQSQRFAPSNCVLTYMFKSKSLIELLTIESEKVSNQYSSSLQETSLPTVRKSLRLQSCRLHACKADSSPLNVSGAIEHRGKATGGAALGHQKPKISYHPHS